ncbi:hypothetical protein KBX59_02660 [Lentilactobacillus hilgardii]|uniref:Uncharacterized protein n=2 Tax=Lentilactobacillus hilgardii TaxID=1588 RepID=C0XG42_LENH9|nr:hypothetical protein HMPREF0497_2837 [Lentilactobacillus buchneri ATCC 11577]EEI25628.1 hypothetical protein HMPREF0519_0203 [Lentilactobacillus hilgardii DSM 20176 = ATCC 8290]MCP9332283.1 hypothetical protein [Lentilactobacillus hilgardii]MCP9348724.1 hypothetical protein [Lentilactobacillus hilgardii]MCP9351697.1 hypothetical protein [Lentilactobacillus hilgardii]
MVDNKISLRTTQFERSIFLQRLATYNSVHWKLPSIILIFLVLSLSTSAYLLLHNRNPQIIMNQIAKDQSGRTIDKKSVVALSADRHGDQIVLGFTKNNNLIVQFRQRVFGGYSTKGYHINQITNHDFNKPFQLKNNVNQKHINNFVYGVLKKDQTAPQIKGKKLSLINHHGHRIFYAFTKPNESIQVQFNH